MVAEHDGKAAVQPGEDAHHALPIPWQRRCCGIGSKGYRVYDWAIIDTDRPDHQCLIRRSVDDGELAFYHCYNPRHEPAG